MLNNLSGLGLVTIGSIAGIRSSVGWLPLVREVFQKSEVTIRIFGDDYSAGVYRYLTKRHPRYKIIQNKRWGAALLPVPDSFATYLKGKDHESLRRHRNRCLRLGFTFTKIDPLERIEEILAINRSMPERQGRPMSEALLSGDSLRRLFASHPEDCYGVLNDQGVLKAYVDAPVVGEIAFIRNLLGDGEAMDKHVMYLCITEVVREMSERKGADGHPNWVLYDTFFGATEGLRHFKERFGFRPFRVRWVWSS